MVLYQSYLLEDEEIDPEARFRDIIDKMADLAIVVGTISWEDEPYARPAGIASFWFEYAGVS